MSAVQDTHDIPQLKVPVIGRNEIADNTADVLCARIGDGTVCLFRTLEEAETELSQWSEPAVVVPTIVLADDGLNHDEAIELLHQLSIAKDSGYIIATAAEELTSVSKAIDQRQILAVLSHPVKKEVVTGQIRAQVYRWSRDRRGNEPWRQELVEQWQDIDGHDDLIAQLSQTPEQLVPTLLQGIEEILGPRPRLKLPPQTRLTQQGEPVNAVYLVLEGSVSLRQYDVHGDNVLLHHASSGPLIGLMSFTSRSLASFTARTTSDVTVVRITLEQLHRVLTTQPSLSLLLAVTAMRALADRLVRAEQLHIEKELLSEALEKEHERAVKQARAELQEARDELVEAARFAMLGELAAGIAHELNNPVAAITRAAEHVEVTLDDLFEKTDQLRGVTGAMEHAKLGEQLSTRQTRQVVRELSQALGSRELAYRMATSGITDVESAKMLADNKDAFDSLEYATKIGTAVRDINVASRRIIGLVRSLRSYSRSDVDPIDGVNIHTGIEDTLRLSAPKLRGVEIERRYHPELPEIRAFPSRLEQVWTNIIINAAEAMLQAEGEAADRLHTITITTDANATHVSVAISDNGPGIPDEIRDHIFTPHFTTKQGTVHYGLGMGLGIVRQILDAHSGSIDIDSSPEGTTMTVSLPIAGPDESALGEYERTSARLKE